MIIFTYVFVNMGMVGGILPVVGVATAIYELWRHCAYYLRRGLWHVNESIRHHRIR